ncbi:hypothetical protein GOP47_0010989 [Adiantum capillus-veneris]|uniref:Pentatricopeptide repeat-containing protein n=1 Tax=Adiantum capillus-veneris TaxID=13818 RepID=A0A9D4UW01_ADICA|nr:hypothetical protein GOP47_0010989 [Adiantum capillus-veneris]
MCHSQQAFFRLIHQECCSWNSQIIQYVRDGNLRDALSLYKDIRYKISVHPDASTYVCLLKACAKLKDLDMGQQLSEDIFATRLLETDTYIASSLVNMYAKCNSLGKAQEVFDKLFTHDVVSWTALMSGYVECGHGEEALNCFERLQQEGVSPNPYTYLCGLKACSGLRDTDKGRHLHGEIVEKGWERVDVLGNILVDLYSKFGKLSSARSVFDWLQSPDVVSWTALIGGYAEKGDAEEALALLQEMEGNGIVPNSHTCVCSLKVCANMGATTKGQEIHSHICTMGLETQLLVGSALVNMYGKCGFLSEAQYVFNDILDRDSVLWTALIGGYAEHGYGEEVLYYYEQMLVKSYDSNPITLICALKACGSTGAINAGHNLHSEILKKGLENEFFIGNSLVCMYADCYLFETAEVVICKLSLRDVVAWNTLLTGYVDFGCNEQALECFERMQYDFLSLDPVSCVGALKACGWLGNATIGQDIHIRILKIGFEMDLIVGSTLVDMYMKCGLFAEALEVFDTLTSHDVVSWTALITGYVYCGHGDEALFVFERMLHECACVNAVTFVSSLRACAHIRAIVKGREMHAMVVKRGLEGEPFVGSSLVDMYTKCGMLSEAHDVYLKLQVADHISGTALTSGYIEQGCGEKALDCLQELQDKGVLMNVVALGCGLKACGLLGALVKGQQMHADLIMRGYEEDPLIGLTLVAMYAKCASMREAQDTFDKLAITDMVLWNVLIAGYAQIAESEDVTLHFATMLQKGICPDSATFVHILNSCSDVGLIDIGQMFFLLLSHEYASIVIPDHYTCIIDIFGRVGRIERALAIIQDMPFHPQAVLWHIVLGACQRNKDVDLGRHAFKHAAILNHNDTAAYVLMSNLYADSSSKVLGC